MAFKPIGTLNGEFSPVIVTMPVYNLTLPQGALVSIYPTSATVPSVAGLVHTTLTSYPCLGVTTGPVASTDRFVDIMLCPNGTRGYIDVLQIMNATVLTATGGSGTTLVDSSLIGLPAHSMVGAIIECVTCASGDVKVGQQITLTDNSAGTLTFASVGSTGFASSDTYKIIRLRPQVTNSNPTSLTVAYPSYLSGSAILFLDQTASTGFAAVDLDQTTTAAMRWCYVIGSDNTGTKLDIVITAGLSGRLGTT